MVFAESTRSGAGPSDAALVVAARAGEEWAVEALFRRHAGRVNGLALRLIGRDTDVDDLVQDSFCEAFKGLGRLEAPEAFAGWLRAIVVRQAGKLLRRRRLLSRLGLGRGSFTVDVEALVSRNAPPDVAAELTRIYAAVERLPAGLRIPLVLRRIEGLPLDEVAELAGVSLATVKRRITEAEQRCPELKEERK